MVNSLPELVHLKKKKFLLNGICHETSVLQFCYNSILTFLQYLFTNKNDSNSERFKMLSDSVILYESYLSELLESVHITHISIDVTRRLCLTQRYPEWLAALHVPGYDLIFLLCHSFLKVFFFYCTIQAFFHFGILALLRFLVYCILYTNKTKHLCDAIEFQGHFEFSGNNFFKFKKEKITWLVGSYICTTCLCVCVSASVQYGVCGLDDKVTHFMVSVQWGGSLLSNKSLHSPRCKLSFGRYIF